MRDGPVENRMEKINRLKGRRRGSVMWMVRVALDRLYTFIVLALLILILVPIVILRRRMDATVLLIKALRGGWNVSDLPKEGSLR
jgi:hypothetical protein